MKSAGHKGVILGSVAKNNKLGRAYAVAVGSYFGGLLNDFAHHLYGVHIDSGFSRSDVYRGADKVGFAKRLRNALDKRVVAACKALLHQSRVAADEVYAKLLSRPVKRVGKSYHVLALAGSRYHADRGNGNALVDDRDTVFALDILAGLDQILCVEHDLVINLSACLVDVLVKAVQQRNTHCDSSHVKVFVVDHIYGFKYILCFKHFIIPLPLLYFMHAVEDVLMHNVDLGVSILADLVEAFAKLLKAE